jgi:cyanophycinase
MFAQLIGGGWRPEARALVYGPFLDAAGSAADIACIVIDEGDGVQQFERWRGALTAVTACSPAPVLVPVGSQLSLTQLDGADAVLVCGGLTPAYADALGPVAGQLREWLTAGNRPYAGFSAGAAVAASRAVVGGWLRDGAPVCPEDAAEDLEELTVVNGLGLVPFAVDVHCSSWGTLPRLIAAVRAGQAASGLALDEDTALTVQDGTVTVTGVGRAYHLDTQDGHMRLEVLTAGSQI